MIIKVGDTVIYEHFDVDRMKRFTGIVNYVVEFHGGGTHYAIVKSPESELEHVVHWSCVIREA